MRILVRRPSLTRTSMDVRLLTADPPVVRPQDATWWALPQKELASLAQAGLVAAPAHGYYVVPPAPYVGDRKWRPSLEGFALGFAQRVAAAGTVSLMSVSAARVHGALPRAVAVAVVAMPEQRRSLDTAWGRVTTVTRDITRLDTQVTQTDLVEGLITTAEQTMLDLADRPKLAGLPLEQVTEAIVALARRVDWDRVVALAGAQRKRAALSRAGWLAANAVDDARDLPVATVRSKFATTGGLTASHDRPPAEFGLRVEA